MLVSHSFGVALGFLTALISANLVSATLRASLRKPRPLTPSSHHRRGVGAVTATITNTGQDRVAILNLNNVFDTRHEAYSLFVLTNAAGDPVAPGGTHLNYGPPTEDHLLVLEPNATFTRQIDVFQHLGNSAADPGEKFMLTITLPKLFAGLTSYTDLRPVDADTRFDMISMSSNSLTVELAMPMRTDGLQKRLDTGEGPTSGAGLSFYSSDCTSISEIFELGNAGVAVGNLASESVGRAPVPDTPSDSFLPRITTSQAQVAWASSAILESTQGRGPFVRAQCYDWHNTCKPGVYGYAYNPRAGAHNPQFNLIVICEEGLEQAEAVAPNQPETPDTYRSQTLAETMLHELSHINDLVN